VRRALLALVAALVAMVALSGCDPMVRVSEGAYRNAVADGTVLELDRRGVTLRSRPECATRANAASVFTIRCTARTSAGAPVVVTGVATAADTARPREDFTVRVDGRTLLRAGCLGVSCDHLSP
jgi:hypothetical protein